MSSRQVGQGQSCCWSESTKREARIGSTINYLSIEELQQIFDRIAPTLKIRGDKTKQVQVLRDRILLGCMALQGCRSIEMYRANLGDISSSYGQHYLKLDGKNSIRTVILRPDLGEEIAQYRQARSSTDEKLTPESPLLISLSNCRYGQRLSRRGIGYIIDGYLSRCGFKHSDLRRGCEARKSVAGVPPVELIEQEASPNKGDSVRRMYSASTCGQTLCLGERNLSPHSLRHTAGTLSLQNGSSLREVQDFLGHADPKTTAVYTHILGNQSNNPADKIDIDF